MKSGQIIGHYKVLRLLGKGGMGGATVLKVKVFLWKAPVILVSPFPVANGSDRGS